MCSFSTSQHNDLHGLLADLKVKREDLHDRISNISHGHGGISTSSSSQESPRSGTSSSWENDIALGGMENTLGATDVLEGVRLQFQKLHRILRVREEELIHQIQAKRMTLVNAGLQKFHHDVDELVDLTENAASSHRLRSSNAPLLFNTLRSSLEEYLTFFEDMKSLSNLKLTALDIDYDPELKTLAGEYGQFACYRKQAPVGVKAKLHREGTSFKIIWQPPSDHLGEEKSCFLGKYFNIDQSIPPIDSYRIRISVESEGVIATIPRPATDPLHYRYELDPSKLHRSYDVEVQALCLSNENIPVEGVWSEPVRAFTFVEIPGRPLTADTNRRAGVIRTASSTSSKKRKHPESCSNTTDIDTEDTLSHRLLNENVDDEIVNGDEAIEDITITHPQLALKHKMQPQFMKRFGKFDAIHITVVNAGEASGVYTTVDDIIPDRNVEKTRYWLRKIQEQKFPSPLWWLKKSKICNVSKQHKDVYYCLTYTKKNDVKYKPWMWLILIPPFMDDANSANDEGLYFTYSKRAVNNKPGDVNVYDYLGNLPWKTYGKGEYGKGACDVLAYATEVSSNESSSGPGDASIGQMEDDEFC